MPIAAPTSLHDLSGVAFLNGGLRKNDFYPQTARQGVFGTNRAAVYPHDSVGDGQTEPGAARLAIARICKAVERLEYVFQLRLGNTWSIIANGQANLRPARFRSARVV